VLVPEEEHSGAGVVQLVHGVEVRNLTDVYQEDDRKVLHLVGHAGQNLVHLHALRIPVMTESDDNHTLLLPKNRLQLYGDSAAAQQQQQQSVR
jgi:hypothetical protein